MPARSFYHHLHWLQLDTLAVLLLASLGWLLWPRVPPARPRQPTLPPPSVAYGHVDARIVRSLRYPGHFAFATPIGFAGEERQPGAGDRHWSLAGVRPYLPPDPQGLPGRHVPEQPEVPLVRPPPIDAVAPRPVPRPAPAMPLWAVASSDALEERALRVPPPARMGIELGVPAGDVLAHIRLNRHGRVDSVVFSEADGLPWEVLRPLERLLLHAEAQRADDVTDGWIRIRWLRPVAHKDGALRAP